MYLYLSFIFVNNFSMSEIDWIDFIFKLKFFPSGIILCQFLFCFLFFSFSKQQQDCIPHSFVLFESWLCKIHPQNIWKLKMWITIWQCCWIFFKKILNGSKDYYFK